MSNLTVAKQQVVDALLANESIMDGLMGAEAVVLLQWCVTQAELFGSTQGQRLETYGHDLAGQAQIICCIADYIDAAGTSHPAHLILPAPVHR